MISVKQLIVGILCAFLFADPALPAPQTASQQAGEISALIPAVSRNSQPASEREALYWNDLLKTEHSGRARASLSDGSILSLGSDSELKIIQHDTASEQTTLQMNIGKMRSQVEKITKPRGKFEVNTPNAVIGVIGTDFFVSYDADKTTVICYKGRVHVTPLGNARASNDSGQTSTNSDSLTLEPGQMVVITSLIPPGGFKPAETPPSTKQDSLLSTSLSTETPVSHPSHTIRWVTIGGLAAGGLAAGLVAATRSGSPSCKTNPTSANCG
jgi:hypothetical protein